MVVRWTSFDLWIPRSKTKLDGFLMVIRFFCYEMAPPEPTETPIINRGDKGKRKGWNIEKSRLPQKVIKKNSKMKFISNIYHNKRGHQTETNIYSFTNAWLNNFKIYLARDVRSIVRTIFKGIVSRDVGVLFFISLNRYLPPYRAGSGLFFILITFSY
jgi:hypothetical protein